MDKTVHKMKLHPRPFFQIKCGQKTIELRLMDEKRQLLQVGDTIEFTNIANGETIKATVLKLHYFKTFRELYDTLPLLRCGYTAETISAAQPADMEQYYSPEEEKLYGVVGIELSFPV